MLDAGPTGLGGKAPGRPDTARFRAWVATLLAGGDRIAVPEIARYEVRRELFRVGASGGLRRLDHLQQRLEFLAITSPVMDLASELWAHVRRGRSRLLPPTRPSTPTRSSRRQALVTASLWPGDEVIIATTNVAHLARFPGVDAREWWTIV